MPLMFDRGPSKIFCYADHIYCKTAWFPGTKKPAHIGVYERHYKGDVNFEYPHNYCYWNGSEWFVPYNTPAEAVQAGAWGWLVSHFQDLQWRGLTKPVQS